MKTEADATRTNQSEVTGISCGKPDYLSSARTLPDARRAASRRSAGFVTYPQPMAAIPRHCGITCLSCNAVQTGNPLAPGHRQRKASGGAQNERPVRGDSRTGQAIWALGWMGARAVYGIDGEELPLPHALCRNRGAARSNPATFLIFPARVSGGVNLLSGRRPRLKPSKFANGTRYVPLGTPRDFIRAAGGENAAQAGR
jgi:hypothetical protein